MPKKVATFPKVVQQLPVKGQQLRAAAYCRVSTKHEEQQQSLEALKSPTMQTAFKTIPIGCWSRCILILHSALAQINAPVTSGA